jgi:hypothetical protein
VNVQRAPANRITLPAFGVAWSRVILWLSLVALPVAFGGARAASTNPDRQCVDPCIQAVRGERRECVSSVTGVFLDRLDGCHELAATCVGACRSHRQDCRDATDLGQALLACNVELTGRTQECRETFRPGSIRRALCVERARVRGVRCRARAARRARVEQKACRLAFAGCIGSCGPGGPPEGADTCRAQAKDDLQSALAVCQTTFRVTTNACLDKDLACSEACGDGRAACTTPARTSLGAAIGSCNTQRNAALAACATANPDDGQALDACAQSAQAAASTCRDAAREAAQPALTACAADFVACVRSCPEGAS